MATQVEELRRTLARFAADPGWVPAITAAVTDAIHTKLPELGEEMRVSTLASTEAIVRQFADMVARGREPDAAQPPPAAVDYTREFVRRGIPIDTAVRAYYIGHAVFLERWVAALRAQSDDPHALADNIEQGASWTYAYLHTLTHTMVRQYADERERWVRSAATLRSETVRSLLDRERIDPATAAQRLRYELDREHLAFVVWSEDGDDASGDLGAVERAASQLATELGGGATLLVALGRQLVGAWIGSRGASPRVPAGLSIGDADGVAVRAAFGTPQQGPEGFCRSHREAMHTRRVAQLTGRRAGSIVHFGDVALVALASGDPEAAREFVADELGPLAAEDDDTLRLAATLRAYLEERSSPRRTAQRLGVHENTIKNRIRAIEELRGRPADHRIAETLVALRLARIVEEDS